MSNFSSFGRRASGIAGRTGYLLKETPEQFPTNILRWELQREYMIAHASLFKAMKTNDGGCHNS